MKVVICILKSNNVAQLDNDQIKNCRAKLKNSPIMCICSKYSWFPAKLKQNNWPRRASFIKSIIAAKLSDYKLFWSEIQPVGFSRAPVFWNRHRTRLDTCPRVVQHGAGVLYISLTLKMSSVGLLEALFLEFTK